MSVSPPVAVTLRPAGQEDCRRVWLWRNDEETRRASFDSSPIPFETHEPWFRESLRRPDRKIYVVLTDGQPAGAARLDLSDNQALVSLHLAPEWRGRRIGPAALRALTDLAFEALGVDRLLAFVKLENTRSLSAFEQAGFVRMGDDGESPARITLVRSRHAG